MATAEKDVRAQILHGLQRRAGGGQRVPSSVFQEVIGELGLRLGDASVDRVLAVLELEPTSGLVRKPRACGRGALARVGAGDGGLALCMGLAPNARLAQIVPLLRCSPCDAFRQAMPFIVDKGLICALVAVRALAIAAQIDFGEFAKAVAQEQMAPSPSRETAIAGVPTTPHRGTRGSDDPPSAFRESGMGHMAGGTAGREFREALEAQTGRSVPGSASKLPESLRSLPQPHLVRRLAGELNALFNEWDNARIPLDVFREELRALGVAETLEAQRLLRGPGQCTFAQLFRALCATDDTAAVARVAGIHSTSRPATAATLNSGRTAVVMPRAASGGAMGTSSGGGATSLDVFGRGPVPDRLTGKRMGSARHQSRDVVTWRGDFSSSMGTVTGWNTARLGNVDTHGKTIGTRDKEYMAESGAGAVVRGEADGLPPGTTYEGHQLAYTKGRYVAPKGALASSGVSGALHDQVADIDARHRFESVASTTSRVGLGGTMQATGPVTSAGYGSAAGTMLRQQLYSLVRQLDAGSLGVPDFRLRVERLGVAVPPHAEKLLSDFQATGKADFGLFVRAFDAVIAAMRLPEEGQAPSPACAALIDVPTRPLLPGAAERSKPVTSEQGLRALAHGHGNIVTWEGAKLSPEEEAESLRMAGLRPQSARDRSLYDMYAKPRDIVAWNTPVEDLGRESRRAQGPSYIANRSAGDFIAWAAEPGGAGVGVARSLATAGVTGDVGYTGHATGHAGRAVDVLPNGTPVSGRKARVETTLAHQAASTAPPYGTSDDALRQPELYEASTAAGANTYRAPVPAGRTSRVVSPTMRQSVDWTRYSDH